MEPPTFNKLQCLLCRITIIRNVWFLAMFTLDAVLLHTVILIRRFHGQSKTRNF